MMTLHEAMQKILLENGGQGLDANTIAKLNKQRRLYRKNNGEFPDAAQIHARVNKYPQLFRKETVADGNQLIYLKAR